MLAIALGLASSVSWGLADFIGGLKTRTLPVLSVLLIAQPAGLCFAIVAAIALGGDPAPAGALVLVALGGALGLAGLAAFYRALAGAPMGVVAPVAALGVLIPITVGLAGGERPTGLHAAGLLVAVVGVVLASRETEEERRRATRAGLLLATFAAVAFGTFFVAVENAAEHEVMWTLVAARAAGLPLIAIAWLATRPAAPSGADLAPLVAVGFFDLLANLLFALATREGLLSLVSVSASLYPAVTALLAYVILGERLASGQRLGVVLALAGVAMLGAG